MKNKIVFLAFLYTNFIGITNISNTILLISLLPFFVLSLSQNAIFRKYIVYMIMGLAASAISCKIYHNQEYFDTFRAMPNLFYIIFYFLLLYLKPALKDMEKALYKMCLLFCILYIVQFILLQFDGVIFIQAANKSIHEGMAARIKCPATAFTSLSIFLGLSTYLRTQNRKYLMLMILGIIVLILLGYRSKLLFCAIAVAYLFVRKYGFSKRLIGSIILSIVIIFSFIQIPFVYSKINQMSERSVTDNFNNDNYIRVITYNYFEHNHFHNIYERFWGSGYPLYLESKYGKEMLVLEENQGIYFVDWGLYGLSWIVGILPILIMISWSIKAIFLKTDDKYIYLKIWLLYLLVSSILTAEYFKMGNFVIQAVVLYLIEKSNSHINRKRIFIR